MMVKLGLWLVNYTTLVTIFTAKDINSWAI